jgi:hypothetical protein
MKENNNNQNQTINCTVSSCKFNNGQRQQCELENIIVTPVEGCQTKQPDESMCSSYKNTKK